MSIETLVDSVIADHASVVDQIKAGKEKAINILVGKVLSQERNANPAAVMSLIRHRMGLEVVVKEKKQEEVIETIRKVLRVIDIKADGGTLYGYTVGDQSELTFTTKDVVDKKPEIPEDLRKYIFGQFINS